MPTSNLTYRLGRTEYVDGPPAVDIYGLGVLLYRLLTGQTPHIEEDSVKLVTGICGTPPLRCRGGWLAS